MSYSQKEMNEMLNFAKTLAIDAGKLIKEMREGELKFDYKNGIELVTSADIKSDELIRKKLFEKYPEISILSEESLSDEIDYMKPLWIVDPIDGTVNYAHGHYNSAISIAFAVHGEIQLGVVHCPFVNETFYAIKNSGAFLNGKKIQCSDVAELKKALVATGFPYDSSTRDTLIHYLSKVLNNCQDIRRVGSAALDICWVACGRFDAYYETVSLWDMAAGYIIAKEANCEVGHYDNTKKTSSIHDFNSHALLVTNNKIFDKILNLLKG